MKHFTLIIDKLPMNFREYDNQFSLKWALEQQIKRKADECINNNILLKKSDDTTIIDI